MYAVRDDSNPGRSVARLHRDHPALADHRADAVVYDDVTDWSDDIDLTIDPLPGAPPRRRRSSPLLVALLAVAFLMMLGLGALGALVLGAAAVAVAALALAPPPVPTPAPATIVEPPALVAPVEAPPAPPAHRPAAPTPAEPSGTSAPAEGGVDAQLVVMPDPGFRSVPVDRAVKKLHERAGKGEIGSVGGH